MSHNWTLWWRVRWLKQGRLEVAAELQIWWQLGCECMCVSVTFWPLCDLSLTNYVIGWLQVMTSVKPGVYEYQAERSVSCLPSYTFWLLVYFLLRLLRSFLLPYPIVHGLWWTVSRQVKAHVMLTCTNGVSPNHLPAIVSSDRPWTTLSTRAH